MKYHNHIIKKVIDNDVDSGRYYDIYKDNKFITSAWSIQNAKEFIDTFNGTTYSWNVLC